MIPGNWQDVGFDHWPYARRVAHRGAGKLAPENTLAAMRLGASFGYRMFEFDVKLSADGVAVLLHDATLERTTSGRGPLSDLELAALVRLDAGGWHSATYAGEPIPTLEAVARFVLAGDLQANIEIKPSPGAESRTGDVVAREAARLWAGRDVPPLLSSFSEEALEAAARAVPQLPRALLLHELPADWLARCRRLGCVGVDLNHRELSRTLIAQAHAARLKVLCYTVNDPQRAALLESWGLDVLITDAVDEIAPA